MIRHFLLVITPLCLLILALFMSACSENNKVDVIQRAVAIESADECHLCGMFISHFPGPKGELYNRGQQQIKKFCSTRDLFAFLLQPENSHRASKLFVHDMAIAPWQSPDDGVFIDARQAFYVIHHRRQGAMGPTLASFKTQNYAQIFQRQFGGQVVRFSNIDLELLASLSQPTRDG